MGLLKLTLLSIVLCLAFAEIQFLDVAVTIELEPQEYQDPGTLTPYLTEDFQTWLKANNYDSFNFARTDLPGGSYGGKKNSKDTITKNPIIFFHGNSDSALGSASSGFDGWVQSISYFQNKGYKESELYATTWGPNNPELVSQQYHSYAYLNYLRNFVEAVLKYTKADKIDIIGHSMGVTLARKVIKGGSGTDAGTTYNLGDSLADKVDTFLGIAGANWGLVACYSSFEVPTCGLVNGFYPGIAPGPIKLSNFLNDINTDNIKEGQHTFSMLSTADDLILFGDMVWGRYTSQFPTEDDSKIYTNLGHMAMKNQTCDEQYQIITTHQI